MQQIYTGMDRIIGLWAIFIDCGVVIHQSVHVHNAVNACEQGLIHS